jgi:hypothetical protein
VRLVTHMVFSFAVAMWLVPIAYVPYTLMASVLTTVFIDMIGHTRNHGVIRRTWVTHDWLLSALTTVVPLSIVYVLMFPVPIINLLIINETTLITHLMLDAITGHTFLLTHKLRGGGVEWNDPWANAAFIALGLLLIVLRL